MADHTTTLVAGLVILGVLLLLVIILGVLSFCWILLKLRQHERDILQLQGDQENGTIINPHNDTAPRTDSAIEMDDIDPQLANGNPRPLSQASEISNRSRVRARMTIIIKKEQANIYGLVSPLGQVLMTAQHYYRDETNTSACVPVESVQMIDKETNTRSVVSRVFTEDWKEGLPTSLLFKGSARSFDNVVSQNKGIFVHKTVGPRGGHLEISGVSLVIPSDALEEEKLISLGVLWDEHLTPLLTRKQCLLSPLVLCEPDGLTFKKPVTLTFPHAAVNVTSDWIPKILKREGDLTEKHDWEPITLADYEERDVNDNHISLKLNHFTLYTCAGESKPGKTAAKLVHIVAFSGKLQRGSFFKPRIYCLNKYNEELEEVETLVGRMDPTSRMSETTDIIIRDNEQDLMVEMAKIDAENWSLNGERVEVLQFEHIWHAFHPHCTFVMKPMRPTVEAVFCEIHAYQNGAENNAAKLKIAENMPLPISPLSSIEDDPQGTLIRELIILLDPHNDMDTDAGDWRNLAEKMECGLARIRWLGTQSSPTQILIEKWLEDGKTLKDLEHVMKDIHREDAAEEIRKHLPDCEQSTDS